MKLQFLTAGESHGKCLTAILEGMVSGLYIDVQKINEELARRQQGKGRGGRMQIETDSVELLSGVRFSKTTGSPISLMIKNKDFENWQIPMSVSEVDLSNPEIRQLIEEKTITNVRPGHADLSGALKYNLEDVRDVLERSSARETATRVAIGAISKQFLEKFGVEISSEVLAIGGQEIQEADKKIEEAKLNGDSLGGLIKITISNVVVGIGSFTNWNRKLDGMLAQALMSIGAIKSVEVGLGKKSAEILGSQLHDEIELRNGEIYRKTNNAGGIEGGMSNGEPIVLSVAMKPIPTIKKALNSINLKTKEPFTAHFERSDTCAVEACAIVAEAMCAIVIANAYLEKFGGDSIEEILNNFDNYKKMIKERLS